MSIDVRNGSLLLEKFFGFSDHLLSLDTTILLHCTNTTQLIFQVLKKPGYFREISHSECKQQLRGAAKYGDIFFRKDLFHVALI